MQPTSLPPARLRQIRETTLTRFYWPLALVLHYYYSFEKFRNIVYAIAKHSYLELTTAVNFILLLSPNGKQWKDDNTLSCLPSSSRPLSQYLPPYPRYNNIHGHLQLFLIHSVASPYTSALTAKSLAPVMYSTACGRRLWRWRAVRTMHYLKKTFFLSVHNLFLGSASPSDIIYEI
jgi:hypothetical protein